jgi:putative endopeptidase
MKKIISNAVLFVLPALIATSAVQAQDTTAKKEPGINVNFMDKKVKPTDDFFRYVNGTWLDNTQIPNDKTRWGSFDELRQKTDTDALTILKEAAKNPIYKSNTDQGKAINLYKSIMDTVARNKQGIAPLKPYLAKINAVKNVADLQALLIQMAPQGGLGFFGVGIGVDAKNSNRNVINVGPGSVGLPDRDYYVSEDADSKEKRAKYVLHLTKMLQLIGEKPAEAQANADKILAFETTMSLSLIHI